MSYEMDEMVFDDERIAGGTKRMAIRLPRTTRIMLVTGRIDWRNIAASMSDIVFSLLTYDLSKTHYYAYFRYESSLNALKKAVMELAKEEERKGNGKQQQ